MEFLYFLEGIRNPVFDFIFSLITHLGEETLFLVLAIFIFWCVDKRGGYYVLMTGLIGTVVNQWLKLAFRIPRPWVIDPSFSAVESAIPEATGYSFPSGHTQNIAGTFGSIFAFFKRKGLRIAAIVIILLVAFSRMYLGVHTPLDVGVSLLVAFVLVAVLYPVFKSEESFHKFMPFVVIGSVAVTLAFFIYVNVISPEGHEAINLESGMKNGATLFGCMLGLLVVYPIDRFVTKFETGGKWYAQVIKLVLGLIGVLLIKELGRPVLEALVGIFTPTPVYIARAIRYFLIVVFAGAVWPLTFGFFKRLTIPALDRFGERVSAIFKKRTPVTDGAEPTAEPTAGEANGEGSEG